MNGSTWYTERSPQKLVGGIHEAGQLTDLSTKLDNVISMVQKLAQITIQKHNVSHVSNPPTLGQVLMCELCGGGHKPVDCLNELNSQTSMEKINMVGYNRPHQQSFQPQGTYNPNNSRNHPGFSWSNPMGAANPQHFVNRGPPSFQSTQVQSQLPASEAPPQSNLEAMMEKLLKLHLQSDERYRQLAERVDQLSAHNKMLENQLAKQASTSSTRVTGKLPASTENPREHVIAIGTRSDKVLEEPSPPIKASIPTRTVEEEIERILDRDEDEPIVEKNNPQVIDKGKKTVRRYENPLPFPLQETKKSRWTKFLEIVENLKVYVPLLDLLSQVPSYGKFLKEILAKKRKYGEHEMIAMTQEYRALTPRVGRRVTKYKDPGKFTIPCIVGGRPIKGSLCDLGASVSVMPLSLCMKMNFGKPNPINLTLCMADQSTSTVVGILEDVAVRVDKYCPC
ncbi:PREDICTED: uncharacterized protein LOC109185573 [Ipomoea nil]|uniref:uncharacterized protein LOC109185573 n=1 Tax=Ipomoea nil TaxID=35883 RepID=UPI0009015794|nr:PREDICTED: uncharacterized protein LOC109185573 [Ipomoea nil]